MKPLKHTPTGKCYWCGAELPKGRYLYCNHSHANMYRLKGGPRKLVRVRKCKGYHRYAPDAPLCKCGCGRGLYWAGELLTGYKLTCRTKRTVYGADIADRLARMT